MSRLPSFRRSTPSIRRIASIQGLQFRQFHAPSSPSPISHSSVESTNRGNPALGSFLKWISGIGVGSGLGILFWSSSSSSTDSESAFFNRPILSFADGSPASSEAAVQDRRSRSLFNKLSLPENSPKFLLFGGRSSFF